MNPIKYVRRFAAALAGLAGALLALTAAAPGRKPTASHRGSASGTVIHAIFP